MEQVPLNFVPKDVRIWINEPAAKRGLLISPEEVAAAVNQFMLMFNY
ncbi:MAG: hypothetical protein ACTS4V_01110 [Candidatus Hodgkinia cicadicola]